MIAARIGGSGLSDMAKDVAAARIDCKRGLILPCQSLPLFQTTRPITARSARSTSTGG